MWSASHYRFAWTCCCVCCVCVIVAGEGELRNAVRERKHFAQYISQVSNPGQQSSVCEWISLFCSYYACVILNIRSFYKYLLLFALGLDSATDRLPWLTHLAKQLHKPSSLPMWYKNLHFGAVCSSISCLIMLNTHIPWAWNSLMMLKFKTSGVHTSVHTHVKAAGNRNDDNTTMG